MIIDASTLIEFLIGDQKNRNAIAENFTEDLKSPSLLYSETLHVLLKMQRLQKISTRNLSDYIDELYDLNIREYETRDLIKTMHNLKGNISSYDANYVALAITLNEPLLTHNKRLFNGVEKICMIKYV
jgi:predicted nucleic acid-binding protein